ncbi:MAG TPA: hypothetical protein VEU72_04215 [Nitrosopumilaceae archaeon]|nr:hypothetical protein [Nitrosopumilaceae archaeon]
MRKLLSILIMSLMLLSMSQVFGQELTMGQNPVEDIKIVLDESGTAHVTHFVKGNSAVAIQVITVKGNMTNFSVTDQNGNSVQYFSVATAQKSVLFPPTSRNMTIIKYDLTNAVTQINGVWEWNYTEPSDAGYTDFYFPKGADTIWANHRPVYLGDHGLRQHGNGFTLDYIINEPVTLQNVEWQNSNFIVGIQTLSDLGPYTFDQSAKAYSFDINKPHSFVTVIMPQKLLWANEFQGKLNGNGTLTNTFYKNGTHIWIGLHPSKAGTIQLTGTTAIPEFPLFVPLVIGITVVIALQFRNRLNFN